jgi:small neutral amino acid transporter SnatA (MarC family)
MSMVQNTPLALLPLIAGVLVMTARFYLREGAISVFSTSFMLAVVAVVMLVTYMVLLVTGVVPDYAWVGFGGVGMLMTVGGIWSFYR